MPSRTVEFHPEAADELEAARDWYRHRSVRAESEFLAEVEAGLEAVAGAPERWPTYLLGTRRFLCRRFPFGVVYRLSPASVQVIAVAHARRRPGYWVGRVSG